MIEKLKKIAEKSLIEFDYFLVDIEIKGEKKNKIVGIFVDNITGVDLDTLGLISKYIWQAMYDAGISSEFSKINVSSPGITKPFVDPRQLIKHKGRNLFVIKNDGDEIEGELTDTVLSGNDANVVLKKLKKDKKQIIEEIININFSEIRESKIKIKF
jgi:ribosome maturation factor RimP